jgi:protein TonB
MNRRTPKLGLALGAALGLHAGVLLGVRGLGSGEPPGAGAPDGRGSQTATLAHQAVQLRWLHAPTASVSTAGSPTLDLSAPPTATEPAPATVATASAEEPAQLMTLVQAGQPEAASTQVATAAVTMPKALEAAPIAPIEPLPTASQHADTYLPRSALDAGPRPLAPVIVAYPAGVPPGRDKVSMVLALYIDENGHVRRTEPQSEGLEPVFAQAAHDAFLQARFQPGELKGQAVKSRILIEVNFEAERSEPDGLSRGVRLSAAARSPTR